MTFPNGETVTRVRAPAVADPYSGEASSFDWDEATETDITDCAVWAGSTGDPTQDTRPDMTVSDYTIAAPATADVLATDRVRIRGLLCEVVGHPFLWRSPFTGWEPGLIVQANVVTG